MKIVNFTYSIDTERKQVTILDHAKVEELEAQMLANGGTTEQVLPVAHHFAHGVYGRELFIPAGTTLTGKIHKYSNMSILIQGEMLVLTEHGTKHVKAPYVEVAPAGSKRAGHALTDCRWVNVHGTDDTDLTKIEAAFIAQDEPEFLAFCAQQLQLEGK